MENIFEKLNEYFKPETLEERLISELEKDENGNCFRIVNGEKIIQIEEKTENDIALNRDINLWRMRKSSK